MNCFQVGYRDEQGPSFARFNTDSEVTRFVRVALRAAREHFFVWFEGSCGRERRHFREMAPAWAFARRHQEWLHDNDLDCQVPPIDEFRGYQHVPFMLAEIQSDPEEPTLWSDYDECISSLLGLRLGEMEGANRRLGIIAAGPRLGVTSWTRLKANQEGPWARCHLSAWASAPYEAMPWRDVQRVACRLELPLSASRLPATNPRPAQGEN